MRRSRSPQAALIALNAVLLGALGVVTLGPAVRAQVRTVERPRGDYTMVSGRVQGSTAAGVYILDAANQELVALLWDRTQKRLVGVGFRSLSRDGQAAPVPR